MSWNNLPKKEIPHTITSMFDDIKSEESNRWQKMIEHASAYMNRRVQGFEYETFKEDGLQLETAPTYNVIQSCVNTATARITLQKPLPRFLTSGGSESQQEKCRGLEKLVHGVMNMTNHNDVMVRAFRDCCVYPVGLVYVYDDGKEIKLKRTHPSKVVVSTQSTLHTDPVNIFFYDDVPIESLKKRFPKKAAHLEKEKITPVLTGDFREWASKVRYIECWRRPFNGEPGRHVICTPNTLLFDETWNDPHPFVKLTWSWDEMSWYGRSLVDELYPIQKEISRIMDVIAKNNELFAVPYFLVQDGAINDKEEALMSNEIGRMVYYSGPVPPQQVTPDIISPQVFQYLNDLILKAYEVTGISQFSATSKKPPDLESGEALRTYIDVESVRFSVPSKMWEQAHKDLAQRIVEAAGRLQKKNKKFFIKAITRDNEMQKIRFKDVNLDLDDYGIEIYPVSALPQHPAARLDKVLQLAERGILSPAELKSLMDFPDLEKYQRLSSAQYETLERLFEYMLSEDGKYVPPMPLQDLQLGVQMCTNRYLLSIMDGYKPEYSDRLARWAQEAAEMLSPPMQPDPFALPQQGPGQEQPVQGPQPPQNQSLPPGGSPGQNNQ